MCVCVFVCVCVCLCADYNRIHQISVTFWNRKDAILRYIKCPIHDGGLLIYHPYIIIEVIRFDVTGCPCSRRH